MCSLLRLAMVAGFIGVLVCPLSSAAAPPAKDSAPIPAGDVRSNTAFYSVVFYYRPNPLTDTEPTARALAQKAFPGITFSKAQDKSSKPPFLGFEEETAPLQQYPVPEASYFKFKGRGLKEEDIAAIQKTARATRLTLVVPKDDTWTAGRAFTQLAADFATATGATIWDSATRECFSLPAWQERRLASWEAGQRVPDITYHVTIDLYRPDDKSPYLRAITLGMEKFALPDVVIEQVAGSDNRPAGNLINLVCQSLAEKPQLTDPGNHLFRIGDLQAGKLQASFKASLEKKATEEVRLALLNGQRQEGDSDNRLIEVDFRHNAGSTNDERREAALSTLWGASDSVVGIKHDAEIEAASARARQKLPELRRTFLKGFSPGERLLLKAPFARDDEGNEWMWVEVMKWTDREKIEGLLQNDPFYIKRLRSGARVTIQGSKIFDYIYFHSDGTQEGNETGRLMEKQNGPKLQK